MNEKKNDGACCSGSTKKICGRINCCMVFLNFLIGAGFITIAALLLVSTSQDPGDNFTLKNGDDLLKSAIFIVCGFLFLFVVFFGTCAVCYKNCCCSILYSVIALIFGLVLVGVGVGLKLKEEILTDYACSGDVESSIKDYYE